MEGKLDVVQKCNDVGRYRQAICLCLYGVIIKVVTSKFATLKNDHMGNTFVEIATEDLSILRSQRNAFSGSGEVHTFEFL